MRERRARQHAPRSHVARGQHVPSQQISPVAHDAEQVAPRVQLPPTQVSPS